MVGRNRNQIGMCQGEHLGRSRRRPWCLTVVRGFLPGCKYERRPPYAANTPNSCALSTPALCPSDRLDPRGGRHPRGPQPPQQLRGDMHQASQRCGRAAWEQPQGGIRQWTEPRILEGRVSPLTPAASLSTPIPAPIPAPAGLVPPRRARGSGRAPEASEQGPLARHPLGGR